MSVKERYQDGSMKQLKRDSMLTFRQRPQTNVYGSLDDDDIMELMNKGCNSGNSNSGMINFSINDIRDDFIIIKYKCLSSSEEKNLFNLIESE